MTWSPPPMPAVLVGVEFTCESVEDEVAQRVVVHSYPHRDIADLEDTGGEPLRLRIVGHIRGTDWRARTDELERQVRQPGRHVFQHPFRGTVAGRVERLMLTTEDVVHNAVRLRVDFVVGDVRSAVFDLTETTASAAAAIGAAVDDVTAALAALEDA